MKPLFLRQIIRTNLRHLFFKSTIFSQEYDEPADTVSDDV
jgi:hypothetical protein